MDQHHPEQMCSNQNPAFHKAGLLYNKWQQTHIYMHKYGPEKRLLVYYHCLQVA